MRVDGFVPLPEVIYTGRRVTVDEEQVLVLNFLEFICHGGITGEREVFVKLVF